MLLSAGRRRAPERALIEPAHDATFGAAEHVPMMRATLQFSYENVLVPHENTVF
jgi:hypothetical protein